MPKPPKVEQPSKQYRTSAYTVRQFSALPYAERMAVDAACNAAATAKRALAEGGGGKAQTPESQALGDSLSVSGSPTQSSPTQSNQLAMQLANTEFATEETITESAIAPELVGGEEEEDDTEQAAAPTPAPEPPAALLSYSADILTVVSEFVDMHENNSSAGWTHWGPTPLAEGRGVQFAINIHTNTFKCFVTQYSGSIVAFVGALKGITPPAALEWLGINFPLPSDPEDLAEQELPATIAPAAALAPEAVTPVNSEIPESAAAVIETEPVPPVTPPTLTHGAALDGATYQTTNYEQFHLLPENRPVDMGHVRKLVAMITKSNLLHIKPLDVTTDMGVIDGQHRLAAARQLGLPVYYKIGEQLSEANITTLNVAQKNWAGTDYLHYWTVKGKTDYVALSSFMKRHPKLSFSNAKMMLGESTKSNAEEFRAGQWKAGAAYKAEQVAEFIGRLAAEVPTFKQPNHSGFVAAVFHCVNEVEKFQTKIFIERILKNPMMLVPCATHNQFMIVFDAVYNFRIPAENRVDFFKRK